VAVLQAAGGWVEQPMPSSARSVTVLAHVRGGAVQRADAVGEGEARAMGDAGGLPGVGYAALPEAWWSSSAGGSQSSGVLLHSDGTAMQVKSDSAPTRASSPPVAGPCT
jgi:hypothetical protein